MNIPKPKFYITHLYPKEMSIYGDIGNILFMQKQLIGLGMEPIYTQVGIGEKLPQRTDFYFIGGGQDKEQELIAADLLTKKTVLQCDIEDQKSSMLAICGGYQILGREFLTGEGVQIPGLNIIPVTTRAADTSVKSRCIGNILIECNIPELKGQKLVGFENHSGQTYFTDNQSSGAYPLGKTLVGFGNNWEQKIEGCVYKGLVGTYLHGSCLPKNPELCNWLISQAFKNKHENLPDFDTIQNTISIAAKNLITKRMLAKG